MAFRSTLLEQVIISEKNEKCSIRGWSDLATCIVHGERRGPTPRAKVTKVPVGTVHRWDKRVS